MTFVIFILFIFFKDGIFIYSVKTYFVSSFRFSVWFEQFTQEVF